MLTKITIRLIDFPLYIILFALLVGVAVIVHDRVDPIFRKIEKWIQCRFDICDRWIQSVIEENRQQEKKRKYDENLKKFNKYCESTKDDYHQSVAKQHLLKRGRRYYLEAVQECSLKN